MRSVRCRDGGEGVSSTRNCVDEFVRFGPLPTEAGTAFRACYCGNNAALYVLIRPTALSFRVDFTNNKATML